MHKDATIFVAGHRGLVGSAIVRDLHKKGYTNIRTTTRAELDLVDQHAVDYFFAKQKPEYVFLAAAKVGGILANNTYRADFIYQNLQIQNNIIHSSYVHNVQKLLFLGSTCIYPKNAPQPMQEQSLLTGTLEYTNEPYAIAKIAGIKMCESYNIQYGTNFISVMPANLYGPYDNFDFETSHVLSALLRKMHVAKYLSEKKYDFLVQDVHMQSVHEIIAYLDSFGVRDTQVEIWGSGAPRREFLYSEDLADCCVFCMQNVDFAHVTHNTSEQKNTHINIGTGEDITIKDLAYMIKKIVGFEGELVFNTDKPDGTMQKCTDVSRLHSLGWKHTTTLENGIKQIYTWYIKRYSRI